MKNRIRGLIDNTVLQAILTLLVWGVICYLYVTGQAVPDTLLSAGSIILGFYFHSSAQAAMSGARTRSDD